MVEYLDICVFISLDGKSSLEYNIFINRRSRMKTKGKTIVPRNRFARLAAARCAGSHSKPYKTERRHVKVLDRKGAVDMHNYDPLGV